jgi:Phage tail baseplate hub (GPD)
MSMSNLFSFNVSQQAGGRTPVARILLNNQVLDVRAREMQMERGFDKHDAVTLALSSESLENTDDIENQPISFVFGLPPNTEFWYGYVVKVTDEPTSALLNFTLQLIGTTLFMQQGKPRFWANKTIPAVVGDLANSNLLGYHTNGHGHVWKALAQTDESDWQIASALSRRIGYSVFNHLGVVRCEDPAAVYATNGPSLQLVTESNLDQEDRQLLEFQPTRDTEQSYTGMGLKFAYLTSDAKVQWAEQPNYRVYHFASEIPVRSQQEAETLIAALGRGLGRWLQQGQARIDGDASIYPGLCAEIVTTNTGVADRKYNGKWLVTAVNHKMDNQSFQSMLSLARPDSTIPAQVTPYRHFWDADARGKPTMWLQEDGRWMSSWSDSRVRSVM